MISVRKTWHQIAAMTALAMAQFFNPVMSSAWAETNTSGLVIEAPIDDQVLIDLLNAPNPRKVEQAIRDIRRAWTPA